MEDKPVVNQNIFPSVVMKLILSNLDVVRLKICRLVCRSWNVEACRLLRKKTAASSIGSDQPRIPGTLYKVPSAVALKRTLSDFAAVTEAGRGHELPTPFQYLGLSLRRWELPQAWKYVFENQPTIFKLGVMDDRENEVEAEALLEPVGGSFKELLKYISETVEVMVFEVSLESILPTLTFPHLKEIYLPSRCDPATRSAVLFVSLISFSPNLVKISCTPNPQTTAVLQVSYLGNIKELEIHDVYHCKTFKTFKNLDMPMLESLVIYAEENEDNYSVASLSAFIAKFSSKLRKLSVTHLDAANFEQFTLNDLPVCPFLSHLYLPNSKFIVGNSMLRKFPELKSLSVCNLEFEDEDEIIIPFKGLETLHFENIATGSGVEIELETVLHLCPRFPGIIYWEVCSRFVELLDIIARDENTSFDFKRIQHLNVVHFGPYGEDHYREEEAGDYAKSLLGLRHLKGLRHFEISDYHVDLDEEDLDFESVPSLESFTFRLNSGVSYEDFDKMIGKLKQLKTVIVKNCCDFRWSQDMEELFTALPNARCGCRM